MTPKERLLSHEQLVNLIINHQYIPQASQENWRDLLGAMTELYPGGDYEPGCAGCLMDIANKARLYIQMIKDEKEMMSAMQFMTFPAHVPKTEEVKHPEDFKPIIEKRKPGRPKK